MLLVPQTLIQNSIKIISSVIIKCIQYKWCNAVSQLQQLHFYMTRSCSPVKHHTEMLHVHVHVDVHVHVHVCLHHHLELSTGIMIIT